MLYSEGNLKSKVISIDNQMSLIRDTEEVVKFLEFIADKNIMDAHAVQCRLSACHNFFSVVTEEEDNASSMLQNLEVLANRFRNKSKITNDATLRVYKSRVKSSLEDYIAWNANPFDWEKSLSKAFKIKPKKNRKPVKIAPAKAEETKLVKTPQPIIEEPKPIEAKPIEEPPTPPVTPPPPQPNTSAFLLSLPVRKGFKMEISLPEDGLDWKEFQRIGVFLSAYCRDVDFSNFQWGSQRSGNT